MGFGPFNPVTIKGENFVNGATVQFIGIDNNVGTTFVDDQTLTCTPPDPPAGSTYPLEVHLTVTNYPGTANAITSNTLSPGFTYYGPKYLTPSLDHIDPLSEYDDGSTGPIG